MSSFDAPFPLCRMRRLRKTPAVRALLTETALQPENFLYPLFVQDSDTSPVPIPSLPGLFRWPLSELPGEVERLWNLGLRGLLLFPHISTQLKDAEGSEGWNPAGLIPQAIRAIRARVPEMVLVADVALDPYTDHGHDGVLTKDGSAVDNDETLERLARMARVLTAAGADWLAPSDMMDGRVGYLRRELDEAGFPDTSLLAYSAKFASAFYGPFREAIGSQRREGAAPIDKSGYQLNPANRREALREVLSDVREGADLVMVKPAGPYLDIIREARDHVDVPLVAYQVSGEFAQIHAAAERGWLDLQKARDESLMAIRRAGADLIISYFAEAWLRDRVS